MLEKIESNEIMTTRDAVKKYPTKYFMMVITEIVDRCDNDLGYVIYTADDQRDLMKASWIFRIWYMRKISFEH